ncbi:metal ABC transporter ATP-binding protein [Candidatus Uabimicrobium sp. HlEnr_7]|uniref:metal ABC transporter ATP-binding protein n=1 Tax=Candidatus Uabimicrobium helgolandensis TaxID=3095367 RepID=UPI003558D8CF
MTQSKNSECLISVKDLSFSYDKENVLQDVSFDVHNQDCVAIVGPNGGGKSTLLNILCGELFTTKGIVKICNDLPVRVKKHIGYIPQKNYYDEQFPIKVLQVVLLGRLGVSKWPWFSKKDKQIAIENLRKMHMDSFVERFFPSLSGGQKQRVLIARALTTETKILVFDEPTSNLDVHSQKLFYDLLHDLNKDYTVLIVTHNISNVPKFAKSVLFVNKSVDFFSLHNCEEQRFLNWYQEKINV